MWEGEAGEDAVTEGTSPAVVLGWNPTSSAEGSRTAKAARPMYRALWQFPVRSAARHGWLHYLAKTPDANRAGIFNGRIEHKAYHGTGHS